MKLVHLFRQDISMKCKILALLICVGINLSFAQKKSANFVVIDSKGISHDLYEDYLDQGSVVVIDLYFTDCPPCNTIAPLLKASYEKWGSGENNVQFLSLSPIDLDIKINSFLEVHQLIYPSSGIEGGGDIALLQYINDFFGKFHGYPTLLVIKPNGEIIFDIFSNQGDAETVELLDFHIKAALEEELSALSMNVFPNPALSIPKLSISIPKDSEIEILLYDMLSSSIVIRREIISKSGIYDYSSLLSNLASGQYIIVLNQKGEPPITAKFIIL